MDRTRDISLLRKSAVLRDAFVLKSHAATRGCSEVTSTLLIAWRCKTVGGLMRVLVLDEITQD